MEQPMVTIVPDGGWGWVVVAAVAFINMTNQSILSVFGLLFGSQLKLMEQETFTAALIINLNSLALNFSGFFIGPVIKSFKPRHVAAVGCILVSFGLFICGFATHSWHFILGYSFFVGFGLGLIAPSTFMAINSYFSTKRGRAVGVSLAGAGLGQVFIPHLVRLLLDNYNFQIAVLTMSLISFTGLFGAILLKPLKQTQIHNNRQHIKLLLETNDNDDVAKAKKQQQQLIKEIPKLIQNTTTNNQQLKTSTHKKLCSKICHRLTVAMDLELLQDPIFWSIIVGMALVYTSTINFTMLFPHFLQYSVGFTSADTATCMSIIAAADILCRLLLPCITDKLKIPYRIVFLFGTIGLLIARAALAESVDMTSIVIMSIFIGISKSATVLNNNLTISDYCRTEKLAGGLGLNMISKGFIVITVGQYLGWIRDFTNSYVYCLHAQNILLFIVVLFWSPEITYRWFKQRKQIKSGIATLKTMEEETTKDELEKMNRC